MTENLIHITDMHFAYRKTSVFEGITSEFLPGSVYGILGRNGTGKSTLLYTIAGLLHPDRGSIDVLGFNPISRSPHFLQKIFMIPEEFHLPDISIDKFLEYHGRFYPLFDHAQFHHVLQTFEIPDHSLLKMSYGQKKKVLISFGLASGVRVLLMDEPTNGLDIISKNQFKKVIAESINENTTILISSHQVQDLTNLIDHVVIIDKAMIILQNSMRAIGEKLTFQISRDYAEAEAAFFKEPVLGGNLLVALNETGLESNVDLETLYKATMMNPEAIRYALNS